MLFYLDDFKTAMGALKGLKKSIGKSFRPILQCCRVSVDPSGENRLLIEGTDLDVCVRLSLHVSGLTLAGGGQVERFVIDLTDFINALEGFKGENPLIHYRDEGEGKESLSIETSEQNKITLIPDDIDLFPELPVIPENTLKYWYESPFQKEIKKVFHATAKHDPRYSFCGVSVRLEGGNLIFEASDGQRLSRVERNSYSPDPLKKTVVPVGALKAVETLNKAVNSYGGVDFGFVEKNIEPDKQKPAVKEIEYFFALSVGPSHRAETISRVIEDRFPDTKKIWPCESAGISYLFNPDDMTKTLKRFPKNKDDESIKIQFKDDVFSFFKEDGQKRRFLFSCPGFGPSCPGDFNFSLHLNPRYLLDSLSVMDKGLQAGLRFIEPLKPVVLFQGQYKELIMPLNMEKEKKA